MSSRRNRITSFILSLLSDKAEQAGLDVDQFPLDDNLFDLDVIDSLGFLELLASIEGEFGIEVDFSDLDPTQFTTVNGLADLCAAVSAAQV